MSVFGIASFLLASVALHVAVRSHASGFRKLAVLAFLHFPLAGYSAWALAGMGLYEKQPQWLFIAWSVAAASAMAGFAVAFISIWRSREQLARDMARGASVAWFWLVGFDGSMVYLARHSGEVEVVVLAYVVAQIVFGVWALRLVKVHRQSSDTVRAELARFFGLFCLLLLPLAFLAVAAMAFGGWPFVVAYAVAMCAFLLFLPVAALLLVGFRSSPVDLPQRSFTHAQSERRITLSLIALGGIAALANAISFALHFESCGGALVEVPEPKSAWRTLPVVGNEGSSENTLGPFRVHGSTVRYKTYPAGIGDARLGDPKLCFDGTVSLARWFDGFDGQPSYMRSIGELALRRDPKTDTFVVSGTGYPRTDMFVTAFRRDESRRFAFDHPQSASYLRFGGVFVFIGVAILVARRRRNLRTPPPFARRDPVPALAYLAFLIALAAPIALAFELLSLPQPGNEIYVHVQPP